MKLLANSRNAINRSFFNNLAQNVNYFFRLTDLPTYLI